MFAFEEARGGRGDVRAFGVHEDRSASWCVRGDMTNAHPPLALEDIRVASPCTAPWEDMKGDERVRFCGRCEKNVFNLSAMTREEAEALVAGKEGRLCVRFYRRSDGMVLTADCPVGTRARKVRRLVVLAAGVGAAGALGTCASGVLMTGTRLPAHTMGAIAPYEAVEQGVPPTPQVTQGAPTTSAAEPGDPQAPHKALHGRIAPVPQATQGSPIPPASGANSPR
jgi:hypothetical protein